MEKLVYLLWKPDELPLQRLREQLLGVASGPLAGLARRPLSLLLADEWTEPVAKARISRSEPPIAGSLSLWLDCVDLRHPLEAWLAECGVRAAGYLVTESVPIRNESQHAPPGERTPGITMLSLLERPERMPQERWLGFWHEFHTPMAMEVQCTFRYVRNVVVRRLSLGAPAWAGIVEEAFPTEAVTDPLLWYRAEGSQQKLARNMGRMLASVRTFLDVERVESLPMSEYVLA